MVAAFATFIVSVLLIYGIRTVSGCPESQFLISWCSRTKLASSCHGSLRLWCKPPSHFWCFSSGLPTLGPSLFSKPSLWSSILASLSTSSSASTHSIWYSRSRRRMSSDSLTTSLRLLKVCHLHLCCYSCWFSSIHLTYFSVGYYRPMDDDLEPRTMRPWREKTVPMSEQEDVDKEHVLYARMAWNCNICSKVFEIYLIEHILTT